jgi:hypothetical protein
MKNRFVIFFSLLLLVGCDNSVPSVEDLLSLKSTSDLPSLSYSISPSSPTSSSTITVSGSCFDNEAFPPNAIQICIKNGGGCSYPTDFTMTTDCSNGTFSLGVPIGSVSADGSYEVEIVAVDSDSNVSGWVGNSSANYLIDRTPPGAASAVNRLSSTASQGNIASPTFDIQFSNIDAGDSIKLFSNSACTGFPEGSTTASVSGPATVTVQWVPSTALTDGGTYSIYAQALDAAGNLGSCSVASHNYTYDISAPVLTLGSPTLTTVNSSSNNNILLSYNGATSSSLSLGDVGLTYTGSANCNTGFTQVSSNPNPEVYQLNLYNCTGSGTVQITSVTAGRSSDLAGNVDTGAGSGTSITVDNSAPGTFSISGITGGSDSTLDANLNTSLYAVVDWTASTGATSYDVTIYQNDGVTVQCATVNTSSTSKSFSTCPLTAGSQYKVMVTAYKNASSLNASNGLYSFFVNRNPIANSDTYYVNMDSSVQNFYTTAATPQGNDTDPDGDPLTIVSIGSPASGIASLNSGLVTYQPASGFHGLDSFNYTVADSRGGQASGIITVKVVGPGTWLGISSPNWTAPANWCGGANATLSNCIGGSTPNSGTIVLFDDLCSVNCTISTSSNIIVSGIDIRSTFSGTINFGNNNLTTSGIKGYFQAGGTVSFGAGSLNINGGGPMRLYGGTFTASSTQTTVSGFLDFQNSYVFNHNFGTFNLISSTVGIATHFFSSPPQFFDFSLGGISSHQGHDFSNTEIEVLNNLFLKASLTGKKFNNGTIYFSGSTLSNASSTYGYGGNGLIKFIGSSSQNISASVSPFVLPSIEISSVGGTFYCVGYNIVVDGNFNYTSGTTDFSGSTVTFGDSTSPINQNTFINPGSIAFDNVSFKASSNPAFYSRSISGTLNVLGTLNFQSLGGEKINGGKISAQGDVYFLSAGATGSTALEFAGSSTQTLTSSATNILGGTFEMNKSAGILNTSGNLNLAASGQDFLITNGILSLGGNLAISDTLSLAAGTVLNKNSKALSYGLLSNSGTINP